MSIPNPEQLAFNKVHEFSNIFFDSASKTYYHEGEEERILRFDCDGWINGTLVLKPLKGATHHSESAKAGSVGATNHSQAEAILVSEPTFYWELFHPCYSHGFEDFVALFNTRLDCLGTTSRDIRIFFKNDFAWGHGPNHSTEALVNKQNNWKFKTPAYNEFVEFLSAKEPIFADDDRPEKQHFYKFSRFFITPCPFAHLLHNCGMVINARPMYTNYFSYEKIAGWYSVFRETLFNYFSLPVTTYQDATERILINRKYNRNIHNDSVKALQDNIPGLKVIYLEHMTLSEQIQAIAKAKLVITVHGAAMFNMVFAPIGSLLFEILPGPSHMRSVFKHYCEKLTRRHAFYYEGDQHRCTLTTHNYPLSVSHVLDSLKEVGAI